MTTAITGNLPVRQDGSFKSALESKSPQIKQTEWDTYFNWYASKRLQESQRASLKDSLQKGNEKVKTQEVPKTKDFKSDVTLTTPLCPHLPEYPHSASSLSELPFHSEETIEL